MPKSTFYCSNCGAMYPKWLGKCEECGQWNTIAEESEFQQKMNGAKQINFLSLNSESTPISRRLCNISEFDRVLGGGCVAGAVTLIGGDPGIGKSTLLLQIAAALSKNYSVVYVSGEESAEQIKLRAARLHVTNSQIQLACETDIDSIIKSIDFKLDFLIIDSIQTLYSQKIDAVPGTVSQIRACTYELINFAKTKGTCVFVIGHVTKDGIIAGPKILEHMVDTVLYFEGEKGNSYRILRTVKNRYGPCDELGVFEMRQDGLFSVLNPSALFLTQRDQDMPGTVVFAGIEGTRPILVEIQSLISKSYTAVPRRTVVGWDLNRLFMILGVLESKCRIAFSDRDVYLSIAGGLKINEPACDLAIAIGLISSKFNKPISRELCVFGEIGLTGEIRSVARCVDRIKEAEKLGFRNIIIPAANQYNAQSSAQIVQVKSLLDILRLLELSRA